MKYLMFFVLIIFISCTSTEPETEYKPIELEFKTPSNFPPLAYNIAINPPTDKGFELGKKLFYDGRLSSDGNISCGSCHIQQDAFTHHGHTVSHGVNNAVGTRNSPPIQNLGFQTTFMWDGAADHLDLQPIIPLLSEIEMNGDLSKIMTLCKNDKVYASLFKAAFKDGQVNSENLLKALSQFMLMMVSSNSKYDAYIRKENSANFSDDEKNGLAIFNNKCASCHATGIFTDNSFRNNGLAINPLIDDIGRFRLTQLESDRYKFKVPSLRNIELTAPYMHDGRFGSLEAVINHYSNGVVDSQTLDPILKSNSKLGITITDTEKKQLIAFLKTLTDTTFINDKRFSE